MTQYSVLTITPGYKVTQHSVLTITPGYRVTPPAISLADGPVGRPRERHPLLAPEGHHGVERRPAALQPAIGEDARGATVDLWIIVRYLHQYRLGGILVDILETQSFYRGYSVYHDRQSSLILSLCHKYLQVIEK